MTAEIDISSRIKKLREYDLKFEQARNERRFNIAKHYNDLRYLEAFALYEFYSRKNPETANQLIRRMYDYFEWGVSMLEAIHEQNGGEEK